MRNLPRLLRLFAGFVLGTLFFSLTGWIAIGCKESRPHGPSGNAGAGGDGGCPVHLPEPQFVLQISAEDGPVPADARVTAKWSAAEEPPFVLSDPTTWKTLDDSVNLVCIVDHTKPPPTDLSTLVCELWTSGAVDLLVEGSGYDAHEETLQPVLDEKCGGPMSTTLPIVLHRPLPDGGTMP